MTRLIIVRHGQSLANLNGIFAGRSDFDLTDLGHEQADLVGEYLSKKENIDVIYSSDLLRAYNTAVPTSRLIGVPIIKDPSLREIDGGLWDGLNVSEIAKRYPEALDRWINDFSSAVCTGGESISDVYLRAVPHICELSCANNGKTVLITTHAIVAKSFNAYSLGFSETEVGRSPDIKNASINIYEMDGARVLSTAFGITEHLGSALANRTKFNA